MRDGPPNWFSQWLAEQHAEEEDAYYDSLVPYKEMSVQAFINKIGGPLDLAGRSSFEDELRGAIVAAHASGELWVHDSSTGLDLSQWPAWYRNQLHLDLDPRAAARWLLSSPMYKHLVPPEWARVVLKDVAVTAAPTVTPKQRRGPKPTKIERVKSEMRQFTRTNPGRLRTMKQEQMKTIFEASRETCVRARDEVLACDEALEPVGISGSNK